MKNIKLSLVLMFILAISGCVAGSKAVKPSPGEICKPMPPAIEKESLSEIPVVVPSEKAEEKNITETQAAVDIKQVEPVKIPYSQIVNMLNEFIDFTNRF